MKYFLYLFVILVPQKETLPESEGEGVGDLRGGGGAKSQWNFKKYKTLFF